MRRLWVILTLVVCAEVPANESCFASKVIQDLIETSEELDDCFSSDDDKCKLKKKSPDVQANLNSSRLAPLNRKLGDMFMDRATGTVTVTFPNGDMFSASAEKISRCHVITSAHLIFADGNVPVASKDYALRFRSGQSCDTSKAWETEASAKLYFAMLTAADYDCKDAACSHRLFRGHTDLVLLKLEHFDKIDRSFFSLSSIRPKFFTHGQKINCFGYTPSVNKANLSDAESRMYLWFQKDARMFGDDNGRSHKGVLTNAVTRKGMSGGGCVMPTNARELVGVFSKDNKGGGNPAIYVTPSNIASHAPNYLSSFHELSERYMRTTGKRLDNLDRECDAPSP